METQEEEESRKRAERRVKALEILRTIRSYHAKETAEFLDPNDPFHSELNAKGHAIKAGALGVAIRYMEETLCNNQ